MLCCWSPVLQSLYDRWGGHVLVQAQWRVRAQQREGERMAALEGEWRCRDAERSEQVKAARDHYAALARRAQQVDACLWGVWGAGHAAAQVRCAVLARQVHQVDCVRAVREWRSEGLGVPSRSMLCSGRDELLSASLLAPDSAELVSTAVQLSKAVP